MMKTFVHFNCAAEEFILIINIHSLYYFNEYNIEDSYGPYFCTLLKL